MQTHAPMPARLAISCSAEQGVYADKRFKNWNKQNMEVGKKKKLLEWCAPGRREEFQNGRNGPREQK